MERVREARLYAILDTGYSDPREWPQLAEEIIAGGAGILQVRAKNESIDDIRRWATPLLPRCRALGVPLIINDHVSLAAELGADGCHIGQDDLSVLEARAILRPDQLLGKSTHSLAQAYRTSKEDVDYIGYGPLFSTATKPDYIPVGTRDIMKVQLEVGMPVFCIGGINLTTLPHVVAAGARRIVVVSALLQADSPREYAQKLLEVWA